MTTQESCNECKSFSVSVPVDRPPDDRNGVKSLIEQTCDERILNSAKERIFARNISGCWSHMRCYQSVISRVDTDTHV